MKIFALISTYLILLTLTACGGGGPATHAGSGSSSKETGPITDSSKAPRPQLPPGPPPKRLVVKDLKVGSGAVIPAGGGVHIRTNFVALSYRTGKPYEVRWSAEGSFNIGFGPGIEIKGWEKGLVGMRVGGRRELAVPSRLAYDKGALLYVIDLLAAEPDATTPTSSPAPKPRTAPKSHRGSR